MDSTGRCAPPGHYLQHGAGRRTPWFHFVPYFFTEVPRGALVTAARCLTTAAVMLCRHTPGAGVGDATPLPRAPVVRVCLAWPCSGWAPLVSMMTCFIRPLGRGPPPTLAGSRAATPFDPPVDRNGAGLTYLIELRCIVVVEVSAGKGKAQGSLKRRCTFIDENP